MTSFTRQLPLSTAVRTLLQISVLSSLVRRAGFAFWFSLVAVPNTFALFVVLFLAPKFQFRPVWLPMNAWPAGLVCASVAQHAVAPVIQFVPLGISTSGIWMATANARSTRVGL